MTAIALPAPRLATGKTPAPILDFSKTRSFQKLVLSADWKMRPEFQHLIAEAMTESQRKKSFDIDIAFIGLNDDGFLTDPAHICWHKNKVIPGAELPHDERAGGQEQLFVDLNAFKHPKAAIVLWLHEAKERGHDFSKIESATFSLIGQDGRDSFDLQTYNISGMSGSLLYVGIVTNKNGVREFEPIGDVGIGGIQEIVNHYWNG